MYVSMYVSMYISIFTGIQSSSIIALLRSHRLSRNLNIRIYSRPVVIGLKFDEESIEDGLRTVRCEHL